MSIKDLLVDRLVAVHEVEEDGWTVPIWEQGSGQWGRPAEGAELPGSRLPDANVRCLNYEETAIIGEAIVRGNVPGYIVEAWADDVEAMRALRASVRTLVRIEVENGNPEFAAVAR